MRKSVGWYRPTSVTRKGKPSSHIVEFAAKEVHFSSFPNFTNLYLEMEIGNPLTLYSPAQSRPRHKRNYPLCWLYRNSSNPPALWHRRPRRPGSALHSEHGAQPVRREQSVYYLTDHVLFSILRDSAVRDRLIGQWLATKNGQLTGGLTNQIGWLRLLRKASVFRTVKNPSAGPRSSHWEIILYVQVF